MASHIEFGKKGEDLAVAHLQQQQYEILHRNWTYGRKEIDIVARQGDTLVFVEVKTRSSQFFGMPEDAVNPRKTDFLQQAASQYMNQNSLQPNAIRFDIIAVTIDATAAGLQEIVHLEDAF